MKNLNIICCCNNYMKIPIVDSDSDLYSQDNEGCRFTPQKTASSPFSKKSAPSFT